MAGGEEPRPQALLARLGEPDVTIAADGGYRLAQKLGLACELLIGDFDTLSEAELAAARGSGVSVETYPSDKSQSDLELALESAFERGVRCLTIIGALGGEWDHCVANLIAPLSLCQERGVWARLLTSTAEIYLVDTAVVVRAPGQRVSLQSLSNQVQGLTLQGFQYHLTSATLKRSQTLGLANRAVSEEASIDFRKGELLICLPLADC